MIATVAVKGWGVPNKQLLVAKNGCPACHTRTAAQTVEVFAVAAAKLQVRPPGRLRSQRGHPERYLRRMYEQAAAELFWTHVFCNVPD